MANSIKRGENQLVQITLTQQDGSALNVSDLTLCTVTLSQLGANIVTYTLGVSPEIRQGAAANILEIEITKSVSAALKLSLLILEVFMEVSDSEFDVDGFQRDKKCVIISVVNC